MPWIASYPIFGLSSAPTSIILFPDPIIPCYGCCSLQHFLTVAFPCATTSSILLLCYCIRPPFPATCSLVDNPFSKLLYCLLRHHLSCYSVTVLDQPLLLRCTTLQLFVTVAFPSATSSAILLRLYIPPPFLSRLPCATIPFIILLPYTAAFRPFIFCYVFYQLLLPVIYSTCASFTFVLPTEHTTQFLTILFFSSIYPFSIHPTALLLVLHFRYFHPIPTLQLSPNE